MFIVRDAELKYVVLAKSRILNDKPGSTFSNY